MRNGFEFLIGDSDHGSIQGLDVWQITNRGQPVGCSGGDANADLGHVVEEIQAEPADENPGNGRNNPIRLRPTAAVFAQSSNELPDWYWYIVMNPAAIAGQRLNRQSPGPGLAGEDAQPRAGDQNKHDQTPEAEFPSALPGWRGFAIGFEGEFPSIGVAQFGVAVDPAGSSPDHFQSRTSGMS